MPPGSTSNDTAGPRVAGRSRDAERAAEAAIGGLVHRERTALRALLIAATAAHGHRTDPAQLEQLVGAAPIEALPAAAALHRVGGTVRRPLESIRAVPSEVRAELTEIAHRSSLRHLLVTGALNEIRRAFDEVDLSWVAMKGPVVASLLYPDVSDRSYADLDLLIDRRDFPRAVRILEDLGYQHSMHNWALAEEMLAGQVGMTTPSISLDVHWHLHYSQEDRRPFALDPAAMIGRARRVDVSGVSTPTFDPVDTLLTLAFHAARSDGHRLVWLKDVERAVFVDNPDLDELVRRCRRYRCGPPVGLILGRARALLAAKIPEAIIDSVTPRALRATDHVTCKLMHPVQLHERDTVTRLLTRSARSSAVTSVTAVPTRGFRQLRRYVFPPRVNETDDPDEKASYFRAVASVQPMSDSRCASGRP